jgi:hypothetical protein
MWSHTKYYEDPSIGPEFILEGGGGGGPPDLIKQAR